MSNILEWISQEQEEVTEDEFDLLATRRGWDGQGRDHAVLVHRAEQPHRWDPAPTSEKRTTQGRRERMEKASHGVRSSDQCNGVRIHEEVARDSSRRGRQLM